MGTGVGIAKAAVRRPCAIVALLLAGFVALECCMPLGTAEKLGYRILDLPVRWLEGADSRENIRRTVQEGTAGLVRLRHNPPPA
jgi:hypothetical protein